MSVTFTKLFASITESTVWCESDSTRLAWITMLAMSDSRGRVWASVPGLANRARISVDAARSAIATFLAPDPDSRTHDHEGRRIEPIDGGWRLLNHEKYRSIRDEESIKESKRRYINTRREKERDTARGVENVERSRDNAEADAEADKTKARAEKICARLLKSKIKSANPSNPKLTALLKAGVSEDEICDLASEDRSSGKSLSWVVAAVIGRRNDANTGNVPVSQERQKQECCYTNCDGDVAGTVQGRHWCREHRDYAMDSSNFR